LEVIETRDFGFEGRVVVVISSRCVSTTWQLLLSLRLPSAQH
jgi:hypothetical protein